MKVNLSFEFDNSEQAESFLRLVRERANVIASPTAIQVPGLPEIQNGDAPPLLPTHKTPAKSRKGKTKPAEEQAVIPDQLPEPAKVTLEDVQKQVERVLEVRGMGIARNVLSRFGVQKLRDLKPEQYGGVIAHARLVVDGAPA